MENELKQILKAWGKFPANDEADFNCLFNEVWTALNEGLSKEEVEFVIHNEFVNHFGGQGPMEEVSELAAVVTDWWMQQQ